MGIRSWVLSFGSSEFGGMDWKLGFGKLAVGSFVLRFGSWVWEFVVGSSELGIQSWQLEFGFES